MADNNKTTPKLSINDLKYIVMEGGGGKGATYIGAIKALEELMYKSSDIKNPENLSRKPIALLDFQTVEGEKKVPAIRGIAGASAGAINTFVLALGLNSKEIKSILEDYEFNNFLKDIDVGRYRMINSKGELAIGEDTKDKKTNTKKLSEFNKFDFSFTSEATRIGDNSSKKIKRNLVSGVIFKILADGIASNFSLLERGITSLFKNINIDTTPPFIRKILNWLFRSNNNLIARIGIAQTLNIIVFKIIIPLKAKLPFKIKDDTLMALLADRGMFSGFAVREFFMDIVIYAATRETLFHRELVNYFENEHITEREKLFGDKGGIISASDIKMLLNYNDTFNFKNPDRRSVFKVSENKNIARVLELLSNLTFKQLHKITNVNFGLSVSNFTTGLPLYFGHEWTPDFRVMEAVGASMSIPPAIRPVYNEANVIKTTDDEAPRYIKTQAGMKQFIKIDGEFETKDYYFYEHIVKMALVQEMGKDSKYIDVNNAIELNAFLPKLREIVVDKKFKVLDKDKNGDDIYRLPKGDFEIRTTLDQPINGEIYTVDYALYKFFYNATFKGLLLDGGYRNNIPYNFFREKGDENKLDNVLAIKLDNSFPPPLMKNVYNNMEKYVEIEQLLGRAYLENDDPTIRALLNMLDTERIKIRSQVEIIFGNELAEDVIKLAQEKDKEERKKLNRQVKRNNAVIDRLVDDAITYYKTENMSKPWQQPKSILGTAFEGYAYGSEMGQIKDISDHAYIIPLYSYGIGTYDFKMDKIKPLVELAQAKAEEKVKEFFK